VVDRITFEKKTIVMEGLKNPRYMVVEGNKGYVTNWGEGADPSDDYVAVLNLDTYAVESNISLKNGVEQIVAKDGKLYVSHKGAFSTNNIVSVVDIASSEVVEIEVGDNPDEIFFDEAGNLNVLFEGRSIWNTTWTAIESHTEAGIAKIDTNSNTVVSSMTFELGAHPSLISLDNDKLYYALNGSIFSMSTSDTSLPTTALLETGSIYGMTVKNGQLYTLKREFENLSQLKVIALEGTDVGSVIHSSAVGAGASKIYFN
ncbi:MAG: YncE family protein, partial [Flavicella sp.]